MEAAPSEHMLFPEWVELGTRSGTRAEFSLAEPDSHTMSESLARETRLSWGIRCDSVRVEEVEVLTNRGR